MEQGIQTMKRQQNLAYWAEQVEACRSSGLPIKTWCAENGIVPNTYFRWQKKVYRAMCPEQEPFYEVPLAKTGGKAAVSIEIDGISATVYHGADEDTIRSVLRAMRSC